MTIKQRIKSQLKEIKKIKDQKEREKAYENLIKNIECQWEETKTILKNAEEIVGEMLTKEQYIDFERELLHRTTRNSELTKILMQKDKDFANNEIKIMRDYIKKYKIIRTSKKGE